MSSKECFSKKSPSLPWITQKSHLRVQINLTLVDPVISLVGNNPRQAFLPHTQLFFEFGSNVFKDGRPAIDRSSETYNVHTFIELLLPRVLGKVKNHVLLCIT